jgi:hypothetical protein
VSRPSRWLLRDLALFALALLVLAWVLWCAWRYVADKPATSRVGEWSRGSNPARITALAPHLQNRAADLSARPNLTGVEKIAWERAIRRLR